MEGIQAAFSTNWKPAWAVSKLVHKGRDTRKSTAATPVAKALIAPVRSFWKKSMRITAPKAGRKVTSVRSGRLLIVPPKPDALSGTNRRSP